MGLDLYHASLGLICKQKELWFDQRTKREKKKDRAEARSFA
jgi:hypothetical protein